MIVDETAELRDAAEKITLGSSYNYGTSCSSESNVLIKDSVRGEFEAELRLAGVHLCGAEETDRLRALLWPGGRLDQTQIGQPAARLAARIGAADSGIGIKALAAPLPAVNPADPLFGEKLSPLFTLVPFRNFDQAVAGAQDLLATAGQGHSCGIHTTSAERVERLAAVIRSARLLVNQSVALGNSGDFGNGLPFSPTVACGSWGGCGQSENITWRHFLNYTTVSRPIRARPADEQLVFGLLTAPSRVSS